MYTTNYIYDPILYILHSLEIRFHRKLISKMKIKNSQIYKGKAIKFNDCLVYFTVRNYPRRYFRKMKEHHALCYLHFSYYFGYKNSREIIT